VEVKRSNKHLLIMIRQQLQS